MHTPACASSPPSNPPVQALLGPSHQPGALHAPIPCYLLNRSCHKPSFLLQNTPLKFLWLAFTLPQPSLQLLFSGPKPPSPPTLLPTDTTEVSPPPRDKTPVPAQPSCLPPLCWCRAQCHALPQASGCGGTRPPLSKLLSWGTRAWGSTAGSAAPRE